MTGVISSPDLRARVLDLLSKPAVQFAVLLLIALILRCDTFGDPNLDDDDTFYTTVGAAMQHGALPYVDVWDRKPFGLFLIYYLIAGISSAPLAYQLVASAFAAATGLVIALLGAHLTKPIGGLLAGACYLLWLAPLQGFGGQSPIFYNLFIAVAMLLLVRAVPDLERGIVGRNAVLAMLVAGLAITIKTTAVFEAALCGLIAVWIVARARPGFAASCRHALFYAAVGTAPTLLIGFAYWGSGHGAEFWHAVVISNLRKLPPDFTSMGIRALIMFAYLAPLLIVSIFGLMDSARRGRRLILLWLFFALIGLVSVPRFYMHYALPLLVPLCVAAGPFLARRGIGLAATAIIAGLSFWLAPPFQFDATARSKLAISHLAKAIIQHGAARPLLVYDGPPQLYTLAGKPLVTPLTFYAHLSDLAEKDVSHLSTLAETRRVLAMRPGAVVLTTPIRSAPVNQETFELVQNYINSECHLIATEPAFERLRSYQVQVWGDCKP